MVIGVDTHKHVHVAAAIDDLGAVLDTRRFPADSAGYLELIGWARQFGHLITYGIEGTGSYGAGLTSAVRRPGIGVIEVVRTDRRDRRLRGQVRHHRRGERCSCRARRPGHRDPQDRGWHRGDDPADLKVAKDVAVKARTAP